MVSSATERDLGLQILTESSITSWQRQSFQNASDHVGSLLEASKPHCGPQHPERARLTHFSDHLPLPLPSLSPAICVQVPKTADLFSHPGVCS